MLASWMDSIASGSSMQSLPSQQSVLVLNVPEDWRLRVNELAESVYLPADLHEALVILSESQKLGEEVGLVILVGETWCGELAEAVERPSKRG